MATQDDYTRITLRIPKDLHQQLADAAEATSKSMNAEIVIRLQDSFLQAPKPGAIMPASDASRLIKKAKQQIADQIRSKIIENLNRDIAKGQGWSVTELAGIVPLSAIGPDLDAILSGMANDLTAAGYSVESKESSFLIYLPA